MKFSTLAYAAKLTDIVESSSACNFTKWGPCSGPINGNQSLRRLAFSFVADMVFIGTPARRSTRLRLPWMEQSLVISNATHHKAENLCSSDTSWGPDFVGTDGMFCDMGTKTLTPLCASENVHGCINIDDQAKTVRKRSTVVKRAVDTIHKSYEKISHWN